jgi:hypothetical protein
MISRNAASGGDESNEEAQLWNTADLGSRAAIRPWRPEATGEDGMQRPCVTPRPEARHLPQPRTTMMFDLSGKVSEMQGTTGQRCTLHALHSPNGHAEALSRFQGWPQQTSASLHLFHSQFQAGHGFVAASGNNRLPAGPREERLRRVI